MELPLLGHLDGQVIARSREPQRYFYSNPDWAVDDRGLLLSWDRFGGEHAIHLARRDGDGWRKVADLPDAMWHHLLHLPERGLYLILGVLQNTRPRSLALWWSTDSERWHGPAELFGGADFHAGSTPWAIWEERLFVPFEVQRTRRWGSYQYGAAYVALAADPRRPEAWQYTLASVPWSHQPGAEHAGALEGNLVAAPDGQLYNLLRLHGNSRLGRARWTGSGWEWLGLVQGVHHQSKPELFAAGGRWYLLANGWPERRTATVDHPFRNTLCLWEATEADLSRWRLVRVIASDRDPRHAYSYPAGLVVDDTLYIAERHGDDETRSYHDTNCILVREKPGFAAWVEEPALVPYGNEEVGENGEWTASNPQDGLLLSHLDGALYPLTLSARLRLEALPAEVGVVDLLGFATCDLVSLVAVQLVDEGRGATLALSTGGRRVKLADDLTAGRELDLTVTLLSPTRAEVVVDGGVPVRGRTHVASDPTLAGVLPRADRPAADLGRVTVVGRPRLTCGETACPAPELPGALILVDGRGTPGPFEGGGGPAHNAAGSLPVRGGHARWFEPWAGGLLSGPGQPAVVAELEAIPAAWTTGGTVRIMVDDPGTVVLAALGQRDEAGGLRRDAPYTAVLLTPGDDDRPRLAVAWFDGTDRQLVLAAAADSAWLTWALAVGEGRARLFGGEPEGEGGVLCAVDLPAGATAGATHWLALLGARGDEVRGFGGLYLTATDLPDETLAAIGRAGFVTKLDDWPARRPSCATPDRSPAAAAASEQG